MTYDRAQALRRRAAEMLIEAERIERSAARPACIVRGNLDAYALADLLSRAHALHVAFSTSTIDRQPGESPLPRGVA